jgi:uncharacterized cysteine cluster protein YcgN (CxxCxxCC family)
MMARKPFWETKSLNQMTVPEWESLCDGCGLCCLVRFEDEDTGEIIPTRVHCQLFDEHRCTCKDYPNRRKTVPDCIKLTPHNIETLEWMPPSCAYRRLHEGKTLPELAPAGHRRPRQHPQGRVSVRDQTVSELSFSDPEDALDFVAEDLMYDKSDVDWED